MLSTEMTLFGLLTGLWMGPRVSTSPPPSPAAPQAYALLERYEGATGAILPWPDPSRKEQVAARAMAVNAWLSLLAGPDAAPEGASPAVTVLLMNASHAARAQAARVLEELLRDVEGGSATAWGATGADRELWAAATRARALLWIDPLVTPAAPPLADEIARMHADLALPRRCWSSPRDGLEALVLEAGALSTDPVLTGVYTALLVEAHGGLRTGRGCGGARGPVKVDLARDAGAGHRTPEEERVRAEVEAIAPVATARGVPWEQSAWALLTAPPPTDPSPEARAATLLARRRGAVYAAELAWRAWDDNDPRSQTREANEAGRVRAAQIMAYAMALAESAPLRPLP